MEKVRVLIVEDDEAARKNIMAFIEDDGYSVCGVETAEDGLNLLNSECFDVSVVDIMLPGSDGNTFMHKVHERCIGMKFIVYTGMEGYTLPKDLADQGLNEEFVFTKPLYDLGIISDAIARLTTN